MKTYEQMAASVFEKGDRRIKKKQKRKRAALISAVICAAVCAAYPGFKAINRPQKTGGDITNTSYTVSETAQATTEIQANALPSDNYDIGSMESSVTDIKTKIKLCGEEITDEEAARYFQENMTWLKSALCESGVECESLEFSEKGYCHISVSDGELRRNFRDYLAYSDGRLIAIVTLTKDNGVLSASPAFGAPWFDSYNDFLNSHKGEKLVFLYSDLIEVVLLSDGRCVNPMGLSVDCFDGIENPYNTFYMEDAVYIP